MTSNLVTEEHSVVTRKPVQKSRHKARTILTAGAVALTFAVTSMNAPPAVQAAENPQASAQAVIEQLGPSKTINLSTDAGAKQLMTLLESLPEDLKNADPKTTKNYEERLNRALGGVKVAQKDRSLVGKNGEVSAQVNWVACAASLAGVVVQYGVPVAKVVKWLKDGYKIFGGVKNLIKAIRSGAAPAEIGEDAVKVLEGVLGVDGVVAACS